MSTLKVDNIRHNSATSDAITMVSDGTCTAKLTDVGGTGLSHRNVLRNGAMTIHQRVDNTTGINDTQNYFVADGWYYNHGANGTVTASHETDSPDGFSNSIKVTVTSAGTSSGYAQFYQKIEGQDLQRFAKGTSGAKKFAVSFYIKSKVTGNFVLDLYDGDNARSCQQIYTVNQSQTWERKTVIIPADTTGAFNNDVNSSLQIYWKVFDGNQTGTLHTTWQAHTTNADRGVGQVNALASNGDYVQITGCQLEVGDTATSFEHKSYTEEIAKCQRYYYLIYRRGSSSDGNICIGGVGSCYTATSIYIDLGFPTQMRVAPTLEVPSGSTKFQACVAAACQTFDNIGIVHSQKNCSGIYGTLSSSRTAGQVGNTMFQTSQWSEGDRCAFIAEL